MADGYGTSVDELQQAAKDIHQTNDSVQSTLRSLASQLEPLQGAWQGGAATAFHQLIERFQGDAAKLNNALQAIGEQMGMSAQSYQQQEEEQSSSMSNITGLLG